MTSLKSVIPATHVWLEVTRSGSHNAWRRTSPVTPLNLMQMRKHCSSVGLESKARLCKWLPELGSGRLSFWIQNVWLQGQVCFTHHIALLGFSRALRVGHIHVICLSVNFFQWGLSSPWIFTGSTLGGAIFFNYYTWKHDPFGCWQRRACK